MPTPDLGTPGAHLLTNGQGSALPTPHFLMEYDAHIHGQKHTGAIASWIQ